VKRHTLLQSYIVSTIMIRNKMAYGVLTISAPKARSITSFSKLILAGRVIIHAYPFNAHAIANPIPRSQLDPACIVLKILTCVAAYMSAITLIAWTHSLAQSRYSSLVSMSHLSLLLQPSSVGQSKAWIGGSNIPLRSYPLQIHQRRNTRISPLHISGPLWRRLSAM